MVSVKKKCSIKNAAAVIVTSISSCHNSGLVVDNREIPALIEALKCYHDALPKSHVHADLMMQYAIDAKHSESPWEYWEVMPNGMPRWMALRSPSWNKGCKYRRKEDAPKWE